MYESFMTLQLLLAPTMATVAISWHKAANNCAHIIFVSFIFFLYCMHICACARHNGAFMCAMRAYARNTRNSRVTRHKTMTRKWTIERCWTPGHASQPLITEVEPNTALMRRNQRGGKSGVMQTMKLMCKIWQRQRFMTKVLAGKRKLNCMVVSSCLLVVRTVWQQQYYTL